MISNGWLDDAERIEGNDAGDLNNDGTRKLTLHSTEGHSIEGAVGAYQDNNSWPTLTIDLPKRRVAQHLSLFDSARSLRNEPGGKETNRDGTIHVQIELVGFAANPRSLGSQEDRVWFGRKIVGPICRTTGIPVRSTVFWQVYPTSYGKNAPQRLSLEAWDNYSGILGHQHVPENSHGDPGQFDVVTVINAVRGAGDWFDMATERDLKQALKEVLEAQDDAILARPVKKYSREVIKNEVLPLLEDARLKELFKQVLDEQDDVILARPVKKYSRDWMTKNLKPLLQEILVEVRS
jgi:hypothetical protein